MSKGYQVSVIVLNYNTADLLKQFLPSLEKTTYENVELVVADNGSTDSSKEVIRSEFPEIRLISLEKNYGFAGGYNRAIEQISSEYVVLLNSDVEVEANWLTELMQFVNDRPNAIAVQPKILDFANRSTFEYAGAAGGFLDRWGYPFCRGRVFDTAEEDSGQYSQPIQAFWATGAALLIKTDWYKKLGGLDNEFFAHMEEIDLCWRVQNAGGEVWCCPSSVVYHVGGGTLSAQSSRKTFLNFRNNLALIVKNAHSSEWLEVFLIRLILDGVAGLKLLLDGKPNHCWAVIKAHFAFYIGFGCWMKKRRLNESKKKWKDLNGVYHGSVVRQYFLSKKTTFTAIFK